MMLVTWGWKSMRWREQHPGGTFLWEVFPQGQHTEAGEWVGPVVPRLCRKLESNLEMCSLSWCHESRRIRRGHREQLSLGSMRGLWGRCSLSCTGEPRIEGVMYSSWGQNHYHYRASRRLLVKVKPSLRWRSQHITGTSEMVMKGREGVWWTWN